MLSNLISATLRFNFATHIIKNGMYLVPSRPARLETPYIKYTKEKTTGGKGSSTLAEVAAEWKKLSDNEKAKYKVDPKTVEEHAKKIKAY